MNQDVLLLAYQRTVYWVETPDECFPLRIGHQHPEWDKFLASQNVADWVFITAWNPQSRRTAPRLNRQRMAELLNELQGRLFWPGLGVGADGDWYPEPSVCAALSVTVGLALGRRYDQAAIVTGTHGVAAELHVC